MKTIRIIAVLLFALSFSCCKKTMSADEINEKAASGVVLIMNYFWRNRQTLWERVYCC